MGTFRRFGPSKEGFANFKLDFFSVSKLKGVSKFTRSIAIKNLSNIYVEKMGKDKIKNLTELLNDTAKIMEMEEE